MKMLIAIGLFLWIFGFIRVGQTVQDGLLINKTFVRPHFLIYLICGMPKARNVPHGVVAIPSLLLQLHGLLLIICGLISLVLTRSIAVIGGIYICVGLLIVGYILLLYKRNSYRVE